MTLLPLDLHVSGRQAGHAAWLEEQLFALLGGWATTAPEPAVRLHLAPRARHHAWHGEVWSELLPVLPGVDPRGLVVPGPGMAEAVEILAASAPDDTLANLAGVYRVLLPRAVAALKAWQDTMSPVTDGSAARAAGLVLADHLDEWVAGEALLQRLLVDPAGVARAGAHQQRLETILVTARSGA